MGKKMVCFLLALTMVAAAVPSALAAKKDPSQDAALGNIYEWGSFDTEDDFQLVTYNSGKGNLETNGTKSGGWSMITQRATLTVLASGKSSTS